MHSQSWKLSRTAIATPVRCTRALWFFFRTGSNNFESIKFCEPCRFNVLWWNHNNFFCEVQKKINYNNYLRAVRSINWNRCYTPCDRHFPHWYLSTYKIFVIISYNFIDMLQRAIILKIVNQKLQLLYNGHYFIKIYLPNDLLCI